VTKFVFKNFPLKFSKCSMKIAISFLTVFNYRHRLASFTAGLSTPDSKEPSQSGGVIAGAVADGAPALPCLSLYI
jgi:hypothetical protein